MPPKSALSTRTNAKSQPPSEAARSHINKRKTTKQPIPGSERLKRLFTSLCAQIDGGHFTNAVKTCDKSMQHRLLYQLVKLIRDVSITSTSHRTE